VKRRDGGGSLGGKSIEGIVSDTYARRKKKSESASGGELVSDVETLVTFAEPASSSIGRPTAGGCGGRTEIYAGGGGSSHRRQRGAYLDAQTCLSMK